MNEVWIEIDPSTRRYRRVWRGVRMRQPLFRYSFGCGVVLAGVGSQVGVYLVNFLGYFLLTLAVIAVLPQRGGISRMVVDADGIEGKFGNSFGKLGWWEVTEVRKVGPGMVIAIANGHLIVDASTLPEGMFEAIASWKAQAQHERPERREGATLGPVPESGVTAQFVCDAELIERATKARSWREHIPYAFLGFGLAGVFATAIMDVFALGNPGIPQIVWLFFAAFGALITFREQREARVLLTEGDEDRYTFTDAGLRCEDQRGVTLLGWDRVTWCAVERGWLRVQIQNQGRVMIPVDAFVGEEEPDAAVEVWARHSRHAPRFRLAA